VFDKRSTSPSAGRVILTYGRSLMALVIARSLAPRNPVVARRTICLLRVDHQNASGPPSRQFHGAVSEKSCRNVIKGDLLAIHEDLERGVDEEPSPKHLTQPKRRFWQRSRLMRWRS
jgi:hypothetical protein